MKLQYTIIIINLLYGSIENFFYNSNYNLWTNKYNKYNNKILYTDNINHINVTKLKKATRVVRPQFPPYGDNLEKEYKRVCIYPNWSVLRDSNVARIYPEDIDPFLCTHIHYAYANIDVRNLQLAPSQYQDFNHGDHGGPLYERIMKLKTINPNLKILLSIGGWFAKSLPFNRILLTDFTRTQFIENALNFIRHWKFDGLDIHWEYPGAIEYGATVDSKEKFTNFIRYLSRKFKDEYKKNYRTLILSAFVTSNEKRIDDGYEVNLICKYLDYVAVATYDFTGPLDSKTGYNSPLYSRNSDSNNINSSMHLWTQRGCPKNKLLVGIPTYARAFKVTKKTSSQLLLHLGIDSEPYLNPSFYTSEEGIISYYEVCELMSHRETKVYWDDLSLVPFAIVSNDNSTHKKPSSIWISYEDARSARKKAEYVKQMSFAGIAVWSLDMDDFKGLFCNLGPFPIIEAIKVELDRSILVYPEDSSEYSSITSKSFKLNITSSTKTTTGEFKFIEETAVHLEKITSIPITTKKFIETTTENIESTSTHINNKDDNITTKVYLIKKFKAVHSINIMQSLDKLKRILRGTSNSIKLYNYNSCLINISLNLFVLNLIIIILI